MNGLDKRLQPGDTVEISDIATMNVTVSNGSLRLLGVGSGGDSEEYVVLNTELEDGEPVELHPSALLLKCAEGSGMMGEPRVWYALPMSVYGGGD